ncbi:MAG: radical SAM protein [Lentimicrobiaceae bacterium]|nr:radical SAM protein [Lentimicrobiaceae bacterium]
MSILFETLVFGPIRSRRLGKSLGINLMPEIGKICSFNCIYCECGWNPEKRLISNLPKKEVFETVLEDKLKEIAGSANEPDSITFSGNGEPTLHPDFAEIVDITIRLRDKYVPKAKISVLTNGTMLHKKDIFDAISKIDNNIIKLDGGTYETIRNIDKPNVDFDLDKYISILQKFNSDLVIQTCFLRGEHNGVVIDNTTEKEVSLWVEHIKKIKPKKTMIYAIERDTPEKNLSKISKRELEDIADRVREYGFDVECYGE